MNYGTEPRYIAVSVYAAPAGNRRDVFGELCKIKQPNLVSVRCTIKRYSGAAGTGSQYRDFHYLPPSVVRTMNSQIRALPGSRTIPARIHNYGGLNG
jgi:hypothetical protein